MPPATVPSTASGVPDLRDDAGLGAVARERSAHPPSCVYVLMDVHECFNLHDRRMCWMVHIPLPAAHLTDLLNVRVMIVYIQWCAARRSIR